MRLAFAPIQVSYGGLLDLTYYTRLECKLLRKVVTLAQLYATKLPPPSMLSSNIVRRKILLLAALLRVARALRIVDKLIGRTGCKVGERLIERLLMLANFKFDQALRLLQNGDQRWPRMIDSKIKKHCLIKMLTGWRQKAAIQRHYPDRKLDNFAYPSNHFDRLFNKIKYHEEEDDDGLLFKNLESHPKIELTPQSNCPAQGISKKSSFRVAEEDPRRNIWAKWRCLLTAHRYEAIKGRSRLYATFVTWFKWSRLLTQLETYSIALPTNTPLLLPCDSAIETRRHTWKAWRCQTKLHARRVTNLIHDRRHLLLAWRELGQRHQLRQQIAATFDGTRRLRLAMLAWYGVTTYRRYQWRRAEDYHLKKVSSLVWEHWQRRQGQHRKVCQFWGRWRELVRFYGRNRWTALTFFYRKSAFHYLSAWRLVMRKQLVMKRLADEFYQRQVIERVRRALRVWQHALQWISHTRAKIETAYETREAHKCLRQWRRLREIYHQAGIFNRLWQRRKSWLGWRAQWQYRRESHQIRADTFAILRRVLATRRSMQQYGVTRRVGGATKIKNLTWLPMARMWNLWRRRAQLNHHIEWLESKRRQETLGRGLRGWRAQANLKCLLRNNPWRQKNRIFRKWRHSTIAARNRHIRLEATIINKLQDVRFIIIYRTFGRWQQVFQTRKMEEHLCGQNLLYYQTLRRQALLKGWKLAAAQRVYRRLRDLTRRKELLLDWRGDVQRSRHTQRHRAASRALRRWRDQYREAVIHDLQRRSFRHTLRTTFVAWRQRAKQQETSHQKSVEFIGLSNTRYWLQKWRMEAVVRHARHGHISPLPITMTQIDHSCPIDEEVKLGRRPTLTLSKDQLTSYIGLGPNSFDTEFMV